MKLPNNAPFWLQLFVAGFLVYVASSLVLTAIYFARFDADLGAVVAAAVLFAMAGCVATLGSLAALFVIGAKRLRSFFRKQPISA